MNNACAWFKKNYPGAKSTNLMIIPTKVLSSASGFNEPVQIVRKANLKKFVKNVKSFFAEFKSIDLQDLDDGKLQKLLKDHALSREDLLGSYSEIPKTP